MIRIQNLTKTFCGNKIIDNLSTVIKNGEITALVGNNGAGKTTLIRLIAGLLIPDKGSVIMDACEKTGVLLGGDINLYRQLTAKENILFFGQLHGMNIKNIENRINDLNSIFNVKDILDKKVTTLSRGMRQKIAFIISIIHDPDVVLLDEPSTGLDLKTLNEVIEFIKYLKNENKTIIIATHNMFEIADLSDEIIFLREGHITNRVKPSEFFKNSDSNSKVHLLIEEMGD